jgi:hypothetical protein
MYLAGWRSGDALDLYEGGGGGVKIICIYKENKKLRDWKNVFTLHILPWAPHT